MKLRGIALKAGAQLPPLEYHGGDPEAAPPNTTVIGNAASLLFRSTLHVAVASSSAKCTDLRPVLQFSTKGCEALSYPLSMPCSSAPAGDRKLIQIVDAALADSARRSGKWLACRPGCSHCCVGVFAINQLDALRLRNGLAETGKKDPERAARVGKRAMETVARLAPHYPGDPVTGLLEEADDEEACKRWDDFANDEPCPALDPATGTCELYEFRPVMCRTFGPPLMSEGDLGVCELCFDGATEAEISACEMKPDPGNLEAALLEDLEKTTGARGETIIAFALAGGRE